MVSSAPIAQFHLMHLRTLVADVLRSNPFQQARLAGSGLDEGFDSLETFTAQCPLTTKEELCADQAEHPPHGNNLTHALAEYTRFSRTSGTTGQPMSWLDTEEDWQWMLESWKMVFSAAGSKPGERAFFPFSFGPFLGFWTAFDAAHDYGLLAIPGGGMGSAERLQLLLRHRADILCATPTYAIRLAETAAEQGIDLARSTISKIIVAGEPGGCLLEVRQRIESLWPGAHVFDHHGMTEVGPVTYQKADEPNYLRVIHEAYFAEILDPGTLQPVEDGQSGELTLTPLGRTGTPLLRYRTGDLVRPRRIGDDLILEGGILGRVDDMVIVRGVNLHPAAVEALLRQLPGVAEYRVYVDKSAALPEIRLEVEPAPEAPVDLAEQAADALRKQFLLRIPVQSVPAGSLPRFELKARRWQVNP